MYVARERTETSAACPDTRYRHSFICSITMVGIGVRRGRGMYESSRKGLAMHGTRHAVVVTHTRLRESGTVVEEAVEQLRRADFEVTIIDNIEAPDFGSKTPVVPKNTEIVVVLGGDGMGLHEEDRYQRFYELSLSHRAHSGSRWKARRFCSGGRQRKGKLL